MNILSTDIGTSSLKVGIISENGNLIASARKSIQTKNDSFSALQWLPAFVECTQNILLQLKEKNIAPDLKAVSVSGNGPTVVTEKGFTLLWNEPVSTLISQETLQTVKDSHSLFLPNLLKLKLEYTEKWQESSRIFSGPEFFIWQLTEKAVTILPEKRFETAYWNNELLKKTGFSNEDIKKLPEFVETGFIAGNINSQIMNTLGLSGSLPVVCTGPDFVAALIGTNTLKPGKVCDRAGSSEGINWCVEKPVFNPAVRTLPSVIPGLWNISVLIEKSGSLINHFKHQLNRLENEQNSFEKVFDYAFEDKNSQGWKILFELKNEISSGVNCLKNLAQENNLPIDDYMTVTGGQAKNLKWMQEKAQCCGMDLCLTQCEDSELTGDAAVAFASIGIFKSIQEAAEALVSTEKRIPSAITTSAEMKVFKIPENLKLIIFDIDSTLYTSEAYALEQVDVQIRAWADKNGISHSEARNKISEFRKNWSRENGGKKISLGNTFTHFGVSIEESINMRRNLVFPEKFLSRDQQLIDTITKLKSKYKLICVTNNPVLPARKTLVALGIDQLIPEIIGLDTCGKSKPAKEPFQKALELTGCRAEEALSVGDRYDLDLSLPMEMGMGAVLVTGVKDVYKLPQILGL